MSRFQGKKVVFGVSGSIAAYKVVQVVRDLALLGADVHVIMTRSATRFVTPLTFQALSKNRVYTSAWDASPDHPEIHVELSRNADLMVIAPATANTMGKIALGLASDIVSLTALACNAPLIVIPAMNDQMWTSSVVQSHVHRLVERGVTVMQPGYGDLASGDVGYGRLPDPEDILGAIRWHLGRKGPLQGRKLVITAGGTREPLDPVRYIGNRSSGKMGLALSQAAIDMGADVTLIVTNSVQESLPWGAEVVRVETSAEMLEAVSSAVSDAAMLIMAAAVADYAPAQISPSKMKKTGEDLVVRLVETQDILASISEVPIAKVGFAAETENLIQNAKAKLTKKNLDVIIANDAVETIGSEYAKVVIISKDNDYLELPKLPKEDVAQKIISYLANYLLSR
ncbi:phosphopantothenoylcysteine decarboxylase/phosphopantothenate/cysteine ligase [Thermobaculum terrenum ATCC BAA-798]|uniref:Coenzyme A biosynthesis bifunctional protein CoaBC n=1 Tax=Thermobaculum terrenum (strain ATCC BAA-798 / CCMEE 7001 / YNP1) TaxID=525904 RepID=D1CBK7_THET1|nr:bifunctional phosphopantothenoylcysteine decarboxylase/phosphopantothenate--cysteine ligase CoaBC [Thermobaculum terrenum]ACZ42172.1 phosphopantothenoylcysteine decarboxylase/phosphopantothenate/cysteine ligase [Thermobaculum terrenum ATCC BAA-798]